MGQSSSKIPEQHDLVEPTQRFMHEEIMSKTETDEAEPMLENADQLEAELRDKVREGANNLRDRTNELVRRAQPVCTAQRELLLQCMQENSGYDVLACNKLLRQFESCNNVKQ